MFRQVFVTLANCFPPYFQKHRCWVDIYRAHYGAELTQAALECHPLVRFVGGIKTVGNLFGLPVLLQEGTFLFAEFTIDTLGGNRF